MGTQFRVLLLVVVMEVVLPSHPSLQFDGEAFAHACDSSDALSSVDAFRHIQIREYISSPPRVAHNSDARRSEVSLPPISSTLKTAAREGRLRLLLRQCHMQWHKIAGHNE